MDMMYYSEYSVIRHNWLGPHFGGSMMADYKLSAYCNGIHFSWHCTLIHNSKTQLDTQHTGYSKCISM